jgi:diguanylate cyclase (GGDEF)-like protein
MLATLATVYFVAAKLGLKLAFVHASATPVWPATGIALAVFLSLGYGVWPGIFVGAFLANLTTAGSVATSIGIGLGNTLEGLAGAYLVNRFANGRAAFDRARDIFVLAALAATLSTMVSATIGVTSLSLGGFVRWADYGSVWSTWWLGDAVGDLVVAPALLLWSARRRARWTRPRILEAAVLFLLLSLAGLIIFGGLFPSLVRNEPLAFLCVPLFIWAAFRFGQREAAAAIVVLSGIAIWGTLHGFGPFVQRTPNASLLLLQAFIGVMAVMTLSLAAVVSERRGVEEQLLVLALSDSLTGLANHRQLMQVLDGEIKRSQRTQRPFAVLFLDVDRLKRINDRYGHLVGSQALCRVAEALRASSRVIDTAARFGGDEFALVLPESGAAAARLVAGRIAQRLSLDGGSPEISVSVGLAVYPQDGETIEELLSMADGALYEAKARWTAKSSGRRRARA